MWGRLYRPTLASCFHLAVDIWLVLSRSCTCLPQRSDCGFIYTPWQATSRTKLCTFQCTQIVNHDYQAVSEKDSEEHSPHAHAQRTNAKDMGCSYSSKSAKSSATRRLPSQLSWGGRTLRTSYCPAWKVTIRIHISEAYMCVVVLHV